MDLVCPLFYLTHFKLLTNLTGRQTEEGWAIYKEEELGLSNEGGGRLGLHSIVIQKNSH